MSSSFERKRYEEARDAYKKLLALAPDDKKARTMLNKCDLAIEKQAEDDKQTQREEEEIRAQEQRIQEIRHKAKDILGNALLAATPEDKIRIAAEAIQVDPTFGDAYQVMGYAYKEKRNYKVARDCFSHAIKNDPTLEYSYYERGYINAFIDGNPEEALSDMENVIRIDSENHLTWFCLP